MITLHPKTQIAYVPTHANGNLSHQNVEFGFVTSVTAHGAFCRYWNKAKTDLRTKANSELTPFENIVVNKSVSDEKIERAITQYEITLRF